MILTVTPNACVDRTYRVEGFQLDRVNRPSLAHVMAGGKGVNVARVYQTLGGEAVTTGFLGGVNGRIVERALEREGIADRFVRVRGETRTCIAVIDPNAGSQTEINESGPKTTVAQAGKLCRHVLRLTAQQDFAQIVVSGSLPPDAPDTLYADLIVGAHRAGIRAVLDSSGAALRAGLRARPWMVKPNRSELEALLGRSVGGLDEITAAACALRAEYDVTLVAVTLGGDGAVLVTEKQVWYARTPPIEFASSVASGDSFLAAFLWAWNHGERPGDPSGALRLAIGAGAANAAVIGAGICTRDAIHALAAQTGVQQLS